MSEEAKAKAPRKPVARNMGPRPAYLLVNLPEGVSPADIEVVDTTRKAEEALEAIDTGKAGGYIRIMVK
jgi:hypothetical protein